MLNRPNGPRVADGWAIGRARALPSVYLPWICLASSVAQDG